MAYDKSVKATKKNSPAVHTGHAKNDKPASDYAAPHTMSGKKYTVERFQAMEDAIPYATTKAAKDVDLRDPIPNGMSYGQSKEPKTSGIEMRGAGAATKGRMSRGPMA